MKSLTATQEAGRHREIPASAIQGGCLSKHIRAHSRAMQTCLSSNPSGHLRSGFKEKIWRGDYIDLLSLLPSSKDFIYKSDKKEDKMKEERMRPVTKSFNNWL